MTAQDGVVLLHGIFRTARSMRWLGRFLRHEGYTVLNLDYPSTRQSLEEIADTIHPEIERFAKSLTGTLHFVGYSMGGLVIRYYLAKYPPANLGRVVMLGTPNHGSEIADFIQHWWLYRKFFGPAGQQLTTSYEHAATLPACEFGILAGDRSWEPVSRFIIRKPADGQVSIESTKLGGMREHRVVAATHPFFPLNRTAWHHTLRFIKTGSFT